MSGIRLRSAVVLALTVVVHLTLLSRLRIDGVRPDALLLVTIMVGLVAGAERGAVVGFVAGLLADLFVQAPFGLSALVYCLVGFAIGSLQSGILRAAWWIPIATAFAASAGGTFLYAIVGAMVGQGDFVSPRLPLIAVVVGGLNAALAPVALRACTWVFRTGIAERSYAT